jgi:hypothetical protein
MKRKISCTILVVLLISLFIILGSGRKVPAKSGCSNSSLQGSYRLHVTGTTPAGGPFAAVGVFSFDGAGNLIGTLFVRVTGGSTSVRTLSGTYTVSPDCTVADTWNFSDGSSSQHESVIVDDGRGYVILNTTAGENSVISGEARKQFPGHSGE